MDKQKALTIKQNVKILAEKHPEVKTNYNLLIIRYWMKYDHAKTIFDITFCTSSESISRAFRDLVKSGDIELPKNIKELRRKEEKDFRLIYGKGS